MRFIVVIVVANLEDTKFLVENILMAPHCIVPLVILKQQLVTFYYQIAQLQWSR
jgi:hypothetical protein